MADFTDMYNTQLSPEDEAKYQEWAKAHGRQNDTYDYDMRGYFKSGEAQADNGHFPDTFKKPNHPTFSDQSMYNGADGAVGGHWSDSGDEFTPGQTNIDIHGYDELQRYMKEVEPNTKLNAVESKLNELVK